MVGRPRHHENQQGNAGDEVVSKNMLSTNEYWPADTEDEMYLLSSSQHSLAEIFDLCKKKWPDADINDLKIESKYIQTYCIGYDKYDPTDYTDFLIIRRISK